MHRLAEEGWAVSTDDSTLYNRACVHCVPASSAIIQKKKKKKPPVTTPRCSTMTCLRLTRSWLYLTLGVSRTCLTAC